MNLYWKDNVEEAVTWVGSAYQGVAEWVYTHPIPTDVIIGATVLGSLAAIVVSRSRTRRRLRRILWGMRMQRSKNRDAFEKSIISYGITDAIEEAVFRGDMTPARAKEWYHSFANYYGMTELLPVHNQKTVKRGIKHRLNTGLHRLKSIIPGGKPGVEHVDLTYKPVVEKARKKSKYDLQPQAAE